MRQVKTNVVLHAPVIGLDLLYLKTAINMAIKDHIGPSSNLSYYFDANVVVDISASSQQVRVFPPDSKNPWSQVALYALVDITYDYVDDDNMGIFYLSVPGGVQEAVQKCINRICSGIRVGIGSIKLPQGAYSKMPQPTPFSDLDNWIRYTAEKHLETLVPQIRSKL